MKLPHFISLLFLNCMTFCRHENGTLTKEYYSNGVVKSEYYIINDTVKSGPFKFFFPSGKLKFKGYYKDNQSDSNYIFYNENGKITETGSYTLGKLTGEWKSYYENGQIQSVSHWKNDSLVGTMTQYRKNGKIARVDYYSNGKLTFGKGYDSLGHFNRNIYPVVVNSASDTIQCGDKYVSHISLKGLKQFTKGKIEFNCVEAKDLEKYHSGKILAPTMIDTFSNDYVFETQFGIPGLYIIEGRISCYEENRYTFALFTLKVMVKGNHEQQLVQAKNFDKRWNIKTLYQVTPK